jgi:hypothetical protein
LPVLQNRRAKLRKLENYKLKQKLACDVRTECIAGEESNAFEPKNNKSFVNIVDDQKRKTLTDYSVASMLKPIRRENVFGDVNQKYQLLKCIN